MSGVVAKKTTAPKGPPPKKPKTKKPSSRPTTMPEKPRSVREQRFPRGVPVNEDGEYRGNGATNIPYEQMQGHRTYDVDSSARRRASQSRSHARANGLHANSREARYNGSPDERYADVYEFEGRTGDVRISVRQLSPESRDGYDPIPMSVVPTLPELKEYVAAHFWQGEAARWEWVAWSRNMRGVPHTSDDWNFAESPEAQVRWHERKLAADRKVRSLQHDAYLRPGDPAAASGLRGDDALIAKLLDKALDKGGDSTNLSLILRLLGPQQPQRDPLMEKIILKAIDKLDGDGGGSKAETASEATMRKVFERLLEEKLGGGGTEKEEPKKTVVQELRELKETQDAIREVTGQKKDDNDKVKRKDNGDVDWMETLARNSDTMVGVGKTALDGLRGLVKDWREEEQKLRDRGMNSEADAHKRKNDEWARTLELDAKRLEQKEREILLSRRAAEQSERERAIDSGSSSGSSATTPTTSNGANGHSKEELDLENLNFTVETPGAAPS